jgi:hypothetical protein
MSNRVKLSTVLPKQLPEFIREDYPLFIKFLEYYYEYLDSQEVDIKSVRDLDETAEKFVQHIKNEVNYIGSFKQTNPTLDENNVLKNIRSAYRTKGSEESVQTLMRTLFNKEAEVMYPGEYVLRASDGKWQQDVSIFINVLSGNPLNLVGDELNITGSGVVIKTTVQRVEPYSGNIYEVFLDKNFIGEIKSGYTVSFDGVTGVVLDTTTSSSIIRNGAGFRLGQIFEIRSNTGSGTRIKITGVNSTGGITRYSIINFGVGYTDEFYATLSPPTFGLDSNTSPITLVKTPAGLTQSTPSYSETQGFTDYGTIINPNYWNPTYSNGTYVGTKVRGFYNEQIKALSNDYAVIDFRLGAIARYPGSYIKNDGFISDAMKIQDSRYYQAYSYVIRIDELLSTFKEAVKTYVHPAGMALFSDYEVKNYITLTATVQAVINFLRRKFEDEFSVSDEVSQKVVGKYLVDEPIVSETRSFVVTKPLPEETATATQEMTKEFGKNLEDSSTLTDILSQITLNKVVSETLNALDNQALVITKGQITDTISLTDEFDIQQDHVKSLTDSSSVLDSGGHYVVNAYNYDPLYFAEHYANTRTTF